MAVELVRPEKRDGRVFTPPPLAAALCSWAIRAPNEVVVDLGVGEGAFLVAAAGRLRTLGADDGQLAAAIHGTELDPVTLARARLAVRAELGIDLPNVVRGDFYEGTLPVADVIVGNPPYIRRHYQSDPASQRSAVGAPTADGMTDAYCLFLLRACRALRPGGRLAVVVSASWLDMRYGEQLKRALLAPGMSIRLIAGFDGRVFSSALVKTVVLLLERVDSSDPVRFAQLDQTFDLGTLPFRLDDLVAGVRVPGAVVTSLERTALHPNQSWSVHLKAPGVLPALLASFPSVPLETFAESRIGLQTFAKPFFVMTRSAATERGIEPRFLLPCAFSPRDTRCPVLADPADVSHVVFACAVPLQDLPGTGAGRYVGRAMTERVRVRGSNVFVEGYHRAPRLARAGRQPWYNLRSEIERRGSWPILVPRRVFKRFLVVHNQAGVVANEDFLEVRPCQTSLVEPLLAVLASSLGELLLRSSAFQYGGGVFNLNPGTLRRLEVPDLGRLAPSSLDQLSRAWRRFAVSADGSAAPREVLDAVVCDAIGLTKPMQLSMAGALRRLVQSTGEATLRQGRERQLLLFG